MSGILSWDQPRVGLKHRIETLHTETQFSPKEREIFNLFKLLLNSIHFDSWTLFLYLVLVMPTPPVRPKDTQDSATTIGLSIGIVLIMIAFIGFLVWAVNRQRVRITASAPRRRPYMSGTQQKGIESIILESMPVVEYIAGMPTDEQVRVAQAHYPIKCDSQRRSGVAPKLLYPEVAVLPFDEEKGEKVASFNDPNVSNPNYKISPKMCTTESSEQSRSQHEPASCSVCTEDFLDKEHIRILPCAHIFHRHCVDPWLLSFGGTCPLWYAVSK
jgi:hypothetical protein